MTDPTPAAPAPGPPRPIILPPQPGMGCFAKGCITLLIVGFIFGIAAIGGTFYLCVKAADVFTSTEPVDLQLTRTDPAQLRAAEESLNRLTEATERGEETTIGFTGPDLNALIERDKDLDFIHGRVRIDIANSIMTVNVSAPLTDIEWRRLRKRWFNGSAEATVSYEFGMFQFDLHNVELNGHHIPTGVVSGVVSGLNQSFNTHFHDSLEKEGITEFWDQIKSIELKDDKLVITTKAD